MLRNYIQQLMHRQNLTSPQCKEAFKFILANSDPHQVAAFLVLLHAKGETTEELFSIIEHMNELKHTLSFPYPVMDIAGTGGDHANTINISTAASILVASCGVKVVKHGNRGVSSACGTADLLETMKIKIDMSPKQVSQCVKKVGIGFCFAPHYHPAMKNVKSIRSALGVRTTFNLLGPLLNPANAEYCLIGVSQKQFLHLFADVLLQTNIRHAMIVHGSGLDELNLLGPVQVVEVKNKQKKEFLLDPKDYGFSYCELKDIQGGNPHKNLQLIMDAFAGHHAPIINTVILNAGVALHIAGRVNSIQQGIKLAQERMQAGVPLQVIKKWQEFSEECTGDPEN